MAKDRITDPATYDAEYDPWAIERNRLLGAISDSIKKGKDIGNKVQIPIPFLGDLGVGDLYFGEAPEYLDDLSYGMRGTSGSGQTTTLDPRAADVAFLPLPWAAGSKLVGSGKNALVKMLAKEYAEAQAPKAAEHLQNASRRKFLQDAGMAGAGAAVTAASSHPLFQAVKEMAKEAAPEMAVKTVGRVANKVPVSLGEKALSRFIIKVPGASEAFDKAGLAGLKTFLKDDAKLAVDIGDDITEEGVQHALSGNAVRNHNLDPSMVDNPFFWDELDDHLDYMKKLSPEEITEYLDPNFDNDGLMNFGEAFYDTILSGDTNLGADFEKMVKERMVKAGLSKEQQNAVWKEIGDPEKYIDKTDDAYIGGFLLDRSGEGATIGFDSFGISETFPPGK